MSLYGKKNKIYKIKPKKYILKKMWFWLVVLFIIIVSAFFYFFLFYSGIQVKNIIIYGNENIKTQDLLDVVSSDSKTGLVNFLGINVISKSIFLVNNDKIVEDILKKFPGIEQITLNKKIPQTLNLIVSERKSAGVYCSSSTSQNDNCFLIDKNGIIFEALKTVPDNLTIVRQSVENVEIVIGKEVVSQSVIDVMVKAQKKLKDNFKISLKEILVMSSLRLNAKTSENWQIYFDLESDINQQIMKLNSLLGGEISKDQRNSLRYIDLRPKDRAIICDNEVCGK